MFYFLVLALLFIVTLLVVVAGGPFTILASFNRIRRKGYRPLGASLIITSAWGMGALGSGSWEFHRFRAGVASELDLLKLPYIVVFIAVSVTAGLFFALPRRIARVSGPRRVPFFFGSSCVVAWRCLDGAFTCDSGCTLGCRHCGFLESVGRSDCRICRPVGDHYRRCLTQSL